MFDNRYNLNPRNAVADAWRPGAMLSLPRRSQDRGQNYGGFAGPFEGWQQSQGTDTWEEFADMFVGWVYGEWSTGVQGTQRSNFMNHYMPTWVNPAGD